MMPTRILAWNAQVNGAFVLMIGAKKKRLTGKKMKTQRSVSLLGSHISFRMTKKFAATQNFGGISHAQSYHTGAMGPFQDSVER